MKLIKILLISVLFIPLSFQSFAAPTGQDLGDKWCSDVKMHFYAGGPCLLYTSPSPRDLSTSRMPSSA